MFDSYVIHVSNMQHANISPTSMLEPAGLHMITEQWFIRVANGQESRIPKKIIDIYTLDQWMMFTPFQKIVAWFYGIHRFLDLDVPEKAELVAETLKLGPRTGFGSTGLITEDSLQKWWP